MESHRGDEAADRERDSETAALKVSERRLWCGEDRNGLDSSLATGDALHPLNFDEAVNARIRVVPVPASQISKKRAR